MKPIGGFLDLEITRAQGQPYHSTTALSTGRSCFSFILQELRPVKIYIPYYVCDVLLKPLIDNNIPYEFYKLDTSLEYSNPPATLGDNEYILCVNYFGIKSHYIERIHKQFGNNIIIDNAHAFFQKGYQDCWSFNSARKFFGVPDGAYLYAPYVRITPDLPVAKGNYSHLIKRMLGDEYAYADFLSHEASLGHDIEFMSKLSTHLLSQINYDEISEKRRNNFNYLYNALSKFNKLKLNVDENETPLYYPFLTRFSIRDELIKNNIYIPKLWPEIISRRDDDYSLEKELSRNLILLPIDQRYNESDMTIVINEIMRLIKP